MFSIQLFFQLSISLVYKTIITLALLAYHTKHKALSCRTTFLIAQLFRAVNPLKSVCCSCDIHVVLTLYIPNRFVYLNLILDFHFNYFNHIRVHNILKNIAEAFFLPKSLYAFIESFDDFFIYRPTTHHSTTIL